MIATVHVSNGVAHDLVVDSDLEVFSDDNLNQELARIERYLQHTVDKIEATNFQLACRRRKGNRFINSLQSAVHNRSSTAMLPSIVTSSGVKSFDGLDDCNTYISSDEEEDRLEDEEVECHLESKPTFLSAGSGLLHLKKGRRPAYYDMDDDEYLQDFCYNNSNGIESETKSKIASQRTYNHSLEMIQQMESKAVRAMTCHRQDSSEKLTRSVIHSFTGLSTSNIQYDEQFPDYEDKHVMMGPREKFRDMSVDHVEFRDSRCHTRPRQEPKASSKVNESFDSTSSLVMNRIHVHEGDMGSSVHQFSLKSLYEARTPEVSNKTKSRSNPMLCSNKNSYESPSSVSSSTTACKGRWDKSSERPVYTERHDLDDNRINQLDRYIKRPSPSSSRRSCAGVKLTYRPPNALVMAQQHGASHNKSNSSDEIMQQIRWKEKWLDERDRRFKSVSSLNDMKLHWDLMDDYRNVDVKITKASSQKRNIMKNMKEETEDEFPFDEIE